MLALRPAKLTVQTERYNNVGDHFCFYKSDKDMTIQIKIGLKFKGQMQRNLDNFSFVENPL